MSRVPARGRERASGRVPSVGRKPLGFVIDGKIHAVLDSNVIIYAAWGQSNQGASYPIEKQHLEDIEKQCVEILGRLERGEFVIAVNGYLMDEYRKKLSEHLAKNGGLTSESVNWVMGIVSKDVVGVRVHVDPRKFSRDADDDMLFDGLAADYLVSSNMKDVAPHRLLSGAVTTYVNTVSPSDFLKVLQSPNDDAPNS
jgi:hypothetical protein